MQQKKVNMKFGTRVGKNHFRISERKKKWFYSALKVFKYAVLECSRLFTNWSNSWQ